MVYAKQIREGEVVALLTYGYTPLFREDSDTLIITEEEYNALMEEFKAVQEVPETEISEDTGVMCK